jgi:hypothetical protein
VINLRTPASPTIDMDFRQWTLGRTGPSVNQWSYVAEPPISGALIVTTSGKSWPSGYSKATTSGKL